MKNFFRKLFGLKKTFTVYHGLVGKVYERDGHVMKLAIYLIQDVNGNILKAYIHNMNRDGQFMGKVYIAPEPLMQDGTIVYI